jgi:hypothetical protein
VAGEVVAIVGEVVGEQKMEGREMSSLKKKETMTLTLSGPSSVIWMLFLLCTRAESFVCPTKSGLLGLQSTFLCPLEPPLVHKTMTQVWYQLTQVDVAPLNGVASSLKMPSPVLRMTHDACGVDTRIYGWNAQAL